MWPATINSSWQINSRFTHIEGNTFCAGEEIYEIAGRACGIGLVGIGETGGKVSEGQTAGVYEVGLTVRSLGNGSQG
jgi:hypothetical protein